MFKPMIYHSRSRSQRRISARTPRTTGLPSNIRVTKARVRNADDRVRYIAGNIKKGLESADVHSFAAEAVAGRCGDGWCVNPRDWMGEVCAVADHVRNSVRYTLDAYGMDTYRTPQRTLQMAIGDCDDMAALAGAALHAIGYPVWLKVIRTKGQPDFHHIYVLAGIPPNGPTQVIPVDPTQPQNICGWEPGGIVEQRIYKIE